MIPCCCICGKAAKAFNDPEWEQNDFCPDCIKQLKEMLIQLHWQYKDGHTELIEQRNISHQDEMRFFVGEVRNRYPENPKDAILMACDETSEYFVKGPINGTTNKRESKAV